MRASRAVYSQGSISNNAVIIERPSNGSLRGSIQPGNAATAIQELGYAAYKHSAWLNRIADERGVSVSDLALQVFDPSNPDKVERQSERVEAAQRMGKRAVYWFAEQMRPDIKYPMPGTGLTRSANPTGYPHGFAKVTQDYRIDKPLLRSAQLISGIGAAVSLHDVVVDPAKQGNGIGTALAYTALREQPKNLRATLYTPAGNDIVRTWAEKYGYHEKESFDYKGLFDEPTPFVMYEAPTVSSVIDRMENVNPGLADAAYNSVLSRMFDEMENENMSINPRG